MPKSRPQLLAHLFECLSLQQRWEKADPPSPGTQAMLQRGIQALGAQIKALSAASQTERSHKRPPAAD